MNAILALSCLLIIAGPAHAADVSVHLVAAPAVQAVGAASTLAPIPSLSMPAGVALSGAALPSSGVPGAAMPGAAVPAAAQAALPANATIPGKAAVAPQAQPAEKGPRPAALSQANGIAAAAGEAGSGRAAQASDRVFDNFKAPGFAGELSVQGVEGSRAPRLSPSTSEQRVEPAPAAASALQVFAGKWSRNSGPGPEDDVNVKVGPDSVQMLYTFSYNGGPRHVGGYPAFTNINAGPIKDPTWRGTFEAPGGVVNRVTVTRFSGNRLEERSERTETHLIRIPTLLVETRTLEVRDGRLIETREAILYRKAFFYWGPYSVPTTINTTNIVNPAYPKVTNVYERKG